MSIWHRTMPDTRFWRRRWRFNRLSSPPAISEVGRMVIWNFKSGTVGYAGSTNPLNSSVEL